MRLSISKDDVAYLLKLFEEGGWDELRLELGDFRLFVTRDAKSGAIKPEFNAETPSISEAGAHKPLSAAAEAAPPTVMAAATGPLEGKEDGALYIRAPNLGTFWRQPKPGAPPYVDIGALVEEGTTVGLIEVMKLFTSVKAKLKGRIVDVLAKNGEMVEHGAPLFRLEPVD